MSVTTSVLYISSFVSFLFLKTPHISDVSHGTCLFSAWPASLPATVSGYTPVAANFLRLSFISRIPALRLYPFIC